MNFKKHLLYALFVCIHVIVSQNLWAQSGFFRRTEDAIYGTNVIESANGGYVFAGIGAVDAGTRSELFVVRLTPAGKVQWKKRFGHPGIAGTTPNIVQLRDGSFILGGAIDGVQGVDILVIRLDKTGKVFWKKTIDGGGNEILRGATKTADGGVMLAANLSPLSDQGSQGTLLIRLDQRGKLKWSRLYPSRVEETVGISQTPDNGFILSSSLLNGDIEWEINLRKIDSAGEVLWNKEYEGQIGLSTGGIAVTKDGLIVVAGADADLLAFQPSLVAVDASGQLRWKRKYSYESFAEGILTHVAATSDGGVVAGGYIASGSSYDSLLVKVNKNGKLVWSKVLDLLPGNETVAMNVASDGGVILSPYRRDDEFANEDFLLLKLDSTGKSPICVSDISRELFGHSFKLDVRDAKKKGGKWPMSISKVSLDISDWQVSIPDACP